MVKVELKRIGTTLRAVEEKRKLSPAQRRTASVLVNRSFIDVKQVPVMRGGKKVVGRKLVLTSKGKRAKKLFR